MNESERRQMHESRLDQERENRAEYMTDRKEIERMMKLIREENEAKARMGKKYQPPVDPDCDADLELEADYDSRRRAASVREPKVYRMDLDAG